MHVVHTQTILYMSSMRLGLDSPFNMNNVIEKQQKHAVLTGEKRLGPQYFRRLKAMKQIDRPFGVAAADTHCNICITDSAVPFWKAPHLHSLLHSLTYCSLPFPIACLPVDLADRG